jgi:D-galacturonate reductase
MTATLDVLMCGTGEYTTGVVGDGSATSQSDKKVGVVALVLFDLRRRGKVRLLSMVGTAPGKYPAIRRHFDANIASRYRDMDVTFEEFPKGDARDVEACAFSMVPNRAGLTLCR